MHRNNSSVKFSDKLACPYLGFEASESPFTREFHEYPMNQKIFVEFFRYNRVRVTIFSGTCAALASLR